MANTENTREKKTMRKRARPLRGGSGAVTEEAREKQVRNGGPCSAAATYKPASPVSDAHFWGARAHTLPFPLLRLRNMDKWKAGAVQGQRPASCETSHITAASSLPMAISQNALCSLSGSFILSTEGKNTSRCSFSSSGVLSTVSSNNFKEMTS